MRVGFVGLEAAPLDGLTRELGLFFEAALIK